MMFTSAMLPTMPRKPLAESQKKAGLAARVDPTLIAALQVLADEDDRTLSYMVEKAIREYVEARAAKPPRKPAKP